MSIPYEQFSSRNITEIASVITRFHELNPCYNNQLIISLDSQNWEIFDLRVSKVLFSCPFRRIKDISEWMTTLLIDIANVRSANAMYRGHYKLKTTVVWSAKRILRLYDFDEYFFSNPIFVKYLIDGTLTNPKKETNHTNSR